MTQPDRQPTIIADTPEAAGGRLWWITLAAALAAGSSAAAWYAAADLTLSHYDARAHLVVARRILDSITPGWRQIGAVWLPLPHVLNALPIQWDWAYRTGAVATAISVTAMAAGLASLGRYIARRTGSAAAGLAAALVVLLNPNVLYLQSTPMTEPLLFGLALLSLDAVDRWVSRPDRRRRRVAGWLVVALMLTRYEGWFVGAGLVGIATLARSIEARRGGPPGSESPRALLPYPAAAVLGFMALSKATVGAWFVTGGFYEATNPSRGRPLAAAEEVLAAAADLGSPLLLAAGLAGTAVCVWRAWRRPAWALPVALWFAGALPFIAFHAGHPHRVRYMVPLVVAAGALAGFAAAVWLRPPLDPEAPMVREAQWETPYRLARAPVTAYLDRHWDGTPILASMGSLAHYMQQTSAIGLDIRDFVHEGNAYLWDAAVGAPEWHVRWVIVEEHAEGGDVLATRARADAAYLAAFRRVAEGGGVALYERERERDLIPIVRTGSGNRR